MGWKPVLAKTVAEYAETVHTTIRDVETGDLQVIRSDRKHPYFAQRLERRQGLVHRVSAASPPPSSHGHVYKGPIKGGAWIDAQHLRKGDRLINADGTWAEVVSVSIQKQDLTAYNLSVRDYVTFFVAETANDDAVWVHNCLPRIGRGAWSGTRGDSVWTPSGSTQDAAARKLLSDFGESGVRYRGNNVDLTPFGRDAHLKLGVDSAINGTHRVPALTGHSAGDARKFAEYLRDRNLVPQELTSRPWREIQKWWTKSGYAAHHHINSNGFAEMILVPRAANRIPHEGAASALRNGTARAFE